MGWFVLITSGWMLLLSLLHLVLAVAFRQFLSRASAECAALTDPGGDLKRTAILLPLRGADPFLTRTLESLATQSYSDYQVVLIVDHVSDPAWQICEQFIREHEPNDRFDLQELRDRRRTCSLKCSSLIQAVEQLGEDVEWVVLTDADVVHHSTWLEELVSPLTDSAVGVSTGQQWFVPSRPTLGSIVRSVWNSGAIVPTAMLGHPWAGSVALRRSDIFRSGLLTEWSHSIVDDGPIAGALARLDLKTQFVPSVIMLNREQTSVRFCWSYIRRMLTWSRLFESTYPLTVVHATVLQGSVCWTIGLSLYALLLGSTWSSVCMLLSLAAFWLANGVAYHEIRRAVQRYSHDRRLPWPRLTWYSWVLTCIAVPFTHLIYAVSAWRACLVREVTWREITYRIDKRGQVDMLGYRPYSSQQTGQKSEMSL